MKLRTGILGNSNYGRKDGIRWIWTLALRSGSTLGTFEPIVALRDLGRKLVSKAGIGRHEFALIP